MLKHENTDVCRTCGTADAGVFLLGGRVPSVSQLNIALQPFRLLAKLAATFPFREDISDLRKAKLRKLD